jgi:hypothetical protein
MAGRPVSFVPHEVAMPDRARWLQVFARLHLYAVSCMRGLRGLFDLQRVGAGIIAALLAIAIASRAQARELRGIRIALERRPDPMTARINLSGRLVQKQGGEPMPGPFNPDPTQDVELVIAPVNAAGLPTPGPFNWAPAARLTVSADTKSARYTTPDGTFDDVVVVTDPRNGVQDTAQITRSVAPPDENTAVMNLSGSLVPKVP